MKDFEKLKELLEKETYPHTFCFKFIGRNSASFEDGTRDLQNRFPKMVHQSRKTSQNGAHVSFTFNLDAKSAEDIIQVYRAIMNLPDLIIVL